ncbi:hypothetical protein [Mycolicibacterium goodii]|uniref:hypothetical protein n=1 Tax=Mycolicibacterium goodii TaxID=134601 RepID=UPI001BDBC611|nr:hypothetical protein [Mycolicibacterium goodii]MBU8829079.1 hypothetical protein [Mycolicibacterium goodii]ULN47607.1 hypothetical protein MI170_30975 [Mycolicibacterium goodii]
MSVHPVVPVLVLAVAAAGVLAVRIAMLRHVRGRAARLRWGGITAAALLLVIAALRPTFGDADQEAVRAAGDREPNVFVLVDRSPGMGPHIAAARADIAELIGRHPDARFAVIGFTSRPTLTWPLSADTWSLRPVVAGLDIDAAADPAQQNVGAAGNVLRYQLISAQQQFPRAANLVYYLGAGAVDSQAPQREFELPEGAVDGGAVLGYDGAERLRAVADQIGVPYVSRTAPLGEVLPDDTSTAATSTPAIGAGRVEIYWAPAGVAALLVLIELYLVLRELRRNTETVVPS